MNIIETIRGWLNQSATQNPDTLEMLFDLRDSITDANMYRLAIEYSIGDFTESRKGMEECRKQAVHIIGLLEEHGVDWRDVFLGIGFPYRDDLFMTEQDALFWATRIREQRERNQRLKDHKGSIYDENSY